MSDGSLRPGETPQLVIRAAASTYAVFSAIFGAAMILISPSVTKDAGDRNILILLIVGYLLALLWIWSFNVILTDRSLTYRSLFGGSRALEIERIAEVKTRIDFRARLGPVFQLRIIPEAIYRERPIVLNMKVFRRRDIERLIECLKESSIHPIIRA